MERIHELAEMIVKIEALKDVKKKWDKILDSVYAKTKDNEFEDDAAALEALEEEIQKAIAEWEKENATKLLQAERDTIKKMMKFIKEIMEKKRKNLEALQKT